MNVIIIGAGKVGYYLSQTLMEHGYKVQLIEKNKDACLRIANQLDIPVICGDGTRIEILDEAGAMHADALVSVTGQDEDNLIACQLGKKRCV